MSNSSPGRLLGSGKDADVFEFGEKVVKLYKTGTSKHAPFREAAALALAESHGLPVPTISDVRQIDGRWGIVMARIDGPSFADRIARQPAEAAAVLATMAAVHARIHGSTAVYLGSLKARLGANLHLAPILTDRQRSTLLEKLASLPEGDCLCHGDFHPWNILGPLSQPAVVDWTSASRGEPAADVCRSFVLMKPSMPDLATAYVETCVRISDSTLERIFTWLPIVAAARLAENVPDEVDGLMAMIGG
jgi:Ser/Thr protein kinase RdoA (MazF antagonist)